MFGLTKREQRWKAEKECAEAVLGLAAVAIKARAEVEVAEAGRDVSELERLRAENVRLRALLCRYRRETPLGHQPHMIAHEVDEVLKSP